MLADDAAAKPGSRNHLLARGLLYWGMQAVFGLLVVEYVLLRLDRLDVLSIVFAVMGLVMVVEAVYRPLTADDWDVVLPADRWLLLKAGPYGLFSSARIGQVLGVA